MRAPTPIDGGGRPEQQARGGRERVRRRGSCGGHPAGAYHRACDSQIPDTERKSARFVTCRARVSSSSTAASSAGARPGASSGEGSATTPSSSCSSGPASTSGAARRGRCVRRAPRVDFEEHAAWVAERLSRGDHLVGHSYGGVVALLAAARVGGDLASLTVVEPPATRVALDVPGGRAPSHAAARSSGRTARDDPEAFMRALPRGGRVGLRPARPRCRRSSCREHVSSSRERGPWEADIPLEALAARRLPTLVVSGGHHPAFEAICDASERRSTPSASSSRASDTTPSSTRSSTACCSTSSRARRTSGVRLKLDTAWPLGHGDQTCIRAQRRRRGRPATIERRAEHRRAG